MVGSLQPARVLVRLCVVGFAVAAVLVATSATPAAASPPSVSAVSPEHLIEMLKERARKAPDAPVVFATTAGQALVLPGEVHGVGFHESGTAGALAMSPVGRLTANLNADRILLPQFNGDPRHEYLVLPTRRRSGGATTAADISMPVGQPVVSPVTGVVTAANAYTLYGRTPDQILEIQPEGRPELRVRMMHVDGVGVQPGDPVTAGETVVAATPRQLPFPSQIDRYKGAHPHVHLEVLHRG